MPKLEPILLRDGPTNWTPCGQFFRVIDSMLIYRYIISSVDNQNSSEKVMSKFIPKHPGNSDSSPNCSTHFCHDSWTLEEFGNDCNFSTKKLVALNRQNRPSLLECDACEAWTRTPRGALKCF